MLLSFSFHPLPLFSNPSLFFLSPTTFLSINQCLSLPFCFFFKHAYTHFFCFYFFLFPCLSFNSLDLFQDSDSFLSPWSCYFDNSYNSKSLSNLCKLHRTQTRFNVIAMFLLTQVKPPFIAKPLRCFSFV